MADNRSPLASPKHRQKQTNRVLLASSIPCLPQPPIATDLHLGKRPQGVSKPKAQKPTRTSARLIPEPSDPSVQTYLAKPAFVCHATSTGRLTLIVQSRSITPQPRGRKRLREAEYLPTDIAIERSAKRSRQSAGSAATTPSDRGAQSEISETPSDPIEYWLRKHTWPKEYFEPDTMSTTRIPCIDHPIPLQSSASL